VAAEDIENHVDIEAGSFGRSLQFVDVPGPRGPSQKFRLLVAGTEKRDFLQGIKNLFSQKSAGDVKLCLSTTLVVVNIGEKDLFSGISGV
jgi:hypothetical protein